MSSVFCKLDNKRLLVGAPTFIASNLQYETMTGSVSYGVSDDTSDLDLIGFCIPPKDHVFPHLAGHIRGFGSEPPSFMHFQQHHIKDTDGKTEVDISIYGIVKYFQLCAENNPNIIDSLFTPVRCVKHITTVGQMVKDNRKMFLHKGCYQKLKGYAYSQLHKMDNKRNSKGKRAESIKRYGVDVKFMYHIVRLLNEAEQILMHGDLDLTANREQLKAIRRGEWTDDDMKTHFESKEKSLDKLFHESKIPDSPPMGKIKQLLIDCLEQHYGNLSECVTNIDKSTVHLKEIKEILDRAGV